MTIEARSSHEPGGRSPLSMAFISPGWPPEGFANGIIPYVANIAGELRTEGRTVTIVALNVKGEVDGVDVREARPFDRPGSLVTRGLDFLTYRASMAAGERRVMIRSMVNHCRTLIQERGLELVEIEESHGWSMGLQRALPIPVVVRIHGPWFVNGPLRGAVEDAKFRRQVRIEGQSLRQSVAITSPSRDVLERTRAYYQMPLEHAEVIPNPTVMVPVEDRWRAAEADRELIVFIGRFDRHKGGDLVIDAFAEVARRRPNARLLFAGPDAKNYADDQGRARTILEHIALRFPDADQARRIEWLGNVPGDAVSALRRKGAVTVIGSRYDNFPTTALEAMAMGCPLVAPRVGGVPEIVDDGVNGLLFEVGDPAAMADQICRVLEDPGLASRLGHQAAADAESRYDPAILARRTEDYYRRVIDDWKRRSSR